jgi:type III restriction enzyme
MANESYEEFARKLQKEIEDEEGIRFGVVEDHIFANITVSTNDHEIIYYGTEKSQKIWGYLKDEGYINEYGKVQDKLRRDLKSDSVSLPGFAGEQAPQILSILRKVAGNLNIKDADDRKQVKLNKAVFLGNEFKELWERIKYKTTYRVQFDSQALIEKCVKKINKSVVVGKARFTYTKSTAEISLGGVEMKNQKEATYTYDAHDFQLPDIISYLQNETNLTRRSIVEILQKSGKLDSFKRNPQKFIEQVLSIIRHEMRLFIVDGIKYQKIGDEYYYAQELFEEVELKGYLSRNMVESAKSVYDHVIYDSDIEANFAKSFEQSSDVKVYAKLPDWFKIDTPLGQQS